MRRESQRADVVIADGLKCVAQTRERFDAIIVDSSEPIGSSAALHTDEFFADCKRALKRAWRAGHPERAADSCSAST
jgi:spermidine synthase